MNLFNLASKSERTKKIIKQIGMSSIYKGFSIAITFFLVPLSITYLGSERYGLWLTVFSFIEWFSFFDFGIGNGLRNKLTIALSLHDIKLAQSYVSTAYFSILLIVLFLILIFIIPFYFISWKSLFNYVGTSESLNQLIIIVYIIFSINLVLKLITTIYYADQKADMPGLIHFLGQVIVLIGIYLAMKLPSNSLVLYGSIVVGSQMMVFTIASLFAFYGKYSYLKPTFKLFNKTHLKDILSLGGKFFLLQLSYILIYSTDNFIINYFLGAEQVTIYNIALKYFMLITMGMNIVLIPYWSGFTNAISLNDMQWIKKSIESLLKISIFVSGVVIIMIFMANSMYPLWIGDKINIPFLLTVFIGIHTIFQVVLQPLIMFINGIGKLKIQLYLGVILALINIPLSIVLAVNYNLGISGVILATVITRGVELFFYPLQVYKILNKTAKGLWNE